MAKFTVRADKELFDAWRVAGFTVTGLSSIAQNDMELSEADIADFERMAEEAKQAIDALVVRTRRNFVPVALDLPVVPDENEEGGVPTSTPSLW